MSTSNKTTFLVLDVHPSVAAKELSMFLGLGPDGAVSLHESSDLEASIAFRVSVPSLDVAMPIFRRHNFSELKGRRIRMAFWPPSVYNRIPGIQIEAEKSCPLWKIYNFFQRFGIVVSVFSRPLASSRPPPQCHKYYISFTSNDGAYSAHNALTKKGPLSDFGHIRDIIYRPLPPHLPNFWTQPNNTLPKTKGSQIEVPTKNTRVIGTPVTSIFKKIQGSSPSTSSNINAKQANLYNHSRSSDNDQNRASSENNSNYIQSHTYSHKRKRGPAEEQRLRHYPRRIAEKEFSLHPGELKVTHVKPDLFSGSFTSWCESAYISYETLYNLSTASEQGNLAISTLAWSTQLDISTARLHYGSMFWTSKSPNPVPVLSSLTVQMREYGDKESAAQVLAIRHSGQLPESRDTLVEGINVTGKGPIMAMKCLESGHLVAATNTPWSLHVWDLRDTVERAKTPIVKLERNKPHDKIWFDVQGMDVCSVDCFGRIHSYDLYKSVSSVGSDATINLDSTARVEIDRDFKFHSSCISINSIDSTVLVGSDEYAQIARWDPRSPNKAVFATMACMDKEGTGQIYDPVYSIEWNPNNSNEFMTTHSKTVRVWDVRKMDHDAFATFHNLGEHTLRKAQWSPHRSDCIAGLTIGGQICIWKIKKFDGPVDQTTPQQIPEMLFRHQGHDLMVSDFAWCPYLEDVISTVAPGSKERAGNIQVWRPRNLHDLDDNGEP